MRLLLVDGHYYLYRSFFAIRELTNSRGEPTNAIFGFTKALRKMLADLSPDLGAVVWDRGLPERRTALQPAYKQQRPEMPEEMRSQQGFMQEFVKLLGLASLSLPDTEADDLIAAYTKVALEKGHEVIIATNDKDILQLGGDRVKIYSTNKADLETPTSPHALLGTDEIRAKWGVEPAQIAEVLALTGDSSDNIPGVEGVGIKTASALIREFGTAAAVVGGADRIASEKLRAKIIAAADRIAENRLMVSLDDHLPLPEPVEYLSINPDYPRLIEAVRSLEFRSLLAELERETTRRTVPPVPQQGELL